MPSKSEINFRQVGNLPQRKSVKIFNVIHTNSMGAINSQYAEFFFEKTRCLNFVLYISLSFKVGKKSRRKKMPIICNK